LIIDAKAVLHGTMANPDAAAVGISHGNALFIKECDIVPAARWQLGMEMEAAALAAMPRTELVKRGEAVEKAVVTLTARLLGTTSTAPSSGGPPPFDGNDKKHSEAPMDGARPKKRRESQAARAAQKRR
jgi:hypothetical protein